MNRHTPRSVYVRRWLLLLAGVIALTWIILQLWPSGAGDDANPTSTSTVTALPPSSDVPTGQPTKAPKPVKPTTPPPPTAEVTLTSGTAACNTRDVAIQPSVRSPQYVEQPVFVDVALTSSAKKPCTFTPKNLDPLVVISHDGDSVWDSSICEAAIVSKPVQLVPGWATTVRVPWIPRESGDSCKDDEDWLEPGDYTLRVGTLGGEPGRTDFELEEAPPPPPKPKPKKTKLPKATPVNPTPVNPTPANSV